MKTLFINEKNIVYDHSSASFIKSAVAKLEKLSVRNSFLIKLYSAQYESVLNREIKLAEMTAKDVILNVGCGAIPFTAIHCALKTGAKIIAIDKDPEVIDKANRTVSDLHLDGLIKIIHSDGKNISYFDYNKVIVALQVTPKQEVFDNLITIALMNTKFLFRQPRKIFRRHYDLLAEDKSIGFVRHNMPTFSKTLLFEKQ